MRFIRSKAQSGFSLLEVMVAAAILGAMALAGSKLMVNQNKSMKTIESKSEVNSIVSEIRSILSDSASCQASFGGSNAENTTGLTRVRQVTPSGTVDRYESNANWRLAKAYGNGNVRITGFALSDANSTAGVGVNAITVPSALPATGVTELIITFSMGEGRVVGSDTIQRRIRINVTTGAGNVNIANCSAAAVDNSLNDANLACTALGGTYDQPTERCNLVNFTTPVPDLAYQAVSTAYLNDFMANWLTTTLDPRYVNVTGDAMTGNLTMNSGADIVMNNGSNLSLTNGTLTLTSGTASIGGATTIGGLTRINNNLEVTGTARIDGETTINDNLIVTGYISMTSDRRLKKEIKELPKGTLAKIRKMRPVKYRWKSNNQIHYGVIAQEMAKIYPDLVTNIGPGDTIGVDYVELIPVLIKGIREMDEENRLLKKSLKKTDRELQMIKKLICERDVDSEICRSERKR